MWLTVKPFEDDSPLIINLDGVEIPEITTSISPVDSMAAPCGLQGDSLRFTASSLRFAGRAIP